MDGHRENMNMATYKVQWCIQKFVGKEKGEIKTKHRLIWTLYQGSSKDQGDDTMGCFKNRLGVGGAHFLWYTR